MEMPAVGAKSQKAFDAVADEIVASTPSQRTKMMGMAAVKVNGKMFMGLWGDAATFKLTDPVHTEALSIRGAKLFDPSGRNRPMKEWVAVPVAQAKRWSGLARAAYHYAEQLTK